MTTLERALSALSRRASEILPLTEAMVRINSHTPNVAGVNLVGEVLSRALKPSSLTRTLTPGVALGDHLCFSTRAAEHAPSILLIGHHDTVFPPGTFESFHVSGDSAHGPGVLDMKGGLALVASVLLALDDADLLAGLPLRFISVSDEEIGSPSSRALLERHAQKARSALVFEAGRAGDAIITSRRGSGHALVTAHGKAAHAGNALAQGRNAIWALAKFVDRVQPLTAELCGVSVNVGLVSGGTARNTVPDLARAELDLRFDDADGQRALFSALDAAAREAAQAVEGTRVDAHVEITRQPMTPTDANRALCLRYAECQREAGLSASEAPRMGGGSDANTVGAVGLPAIDGLGPRGAGFHTRDERIELSSLPNKAEALLRFLLRELQ